MDDVNKNAIIGRLLFYFLFYLEGDQADSKLPRSKLRSFFGFFFACAAICLSV